jgi:hypothetical protein
MAAAHLFVGSGQQVIDSSRFETLLRFLLLLSDGVHGHGNKIFFLFKGELHYSTLYIHKYY